MKQFISIFTICYLLSLTLSAQLNSYPVTVDVKDKSVLSIHGKSNVVDFTFDKPSKEFIYNKLYVVASWKNDKIYLSESNLEIPVKSFNSSNKMALRDFNKLVKSDQYPKMLIKLDHIELADRSSTSAVGNAVIDVTITDVTKRYIFPVTTGKNGNNFTFDITKEINIRDFNLTPPVHMMGMIKVDELITINLFMECDILPLDQAELTK
jgi:hypothetical protein